jgi:hypothetical protein
MNSDDQQATKDRVVNEEQALVAETNNEGQ